MFNLYFQKLKSYINTLLPGIPFLYLLKPLENRRFSNIFREYKKGAPGSNGLIAKKRNLYSPTLLYKRDVSTIIVPW